MPTERNREPFVSFGADVKAAREALGYSRKDFAKFIPIDPRYLANIENSGALPSLPIFYELIKLCNLPVDRYFHPEVLEARHSKGRERVALKLSICPEVFLPIIEGALDAALKLDEPAVEE